MEEWRDVPGYEGLYQVSSAGAVRGPYPIETAIAGGRKGERYLAVTLDGKQHFIHRLVAELFIPNPSDKYSVDHINQNKQDNRVENLRWATRSEQQLNRPHAVGLSGHRHIDKHRNRWRVGIQRNSVTVYRKSFETLPEAIAARDIFLASL